MTYQKLIISGDLEFPPQLHYQPNSRSVTELTIWTYLNDQVVRFYVVAQDGLAKIASSLVCGQQVLIEGRLFADSNTGGPKVQQDDNGQLIARYTIIAEKIIPLEVIRLASTLPDFWEMARAECRNYPRSGQNNFRELWSNGKFRVVIIQKDFFVVVCT